MTSSKGGFKSHPKIFYNILQTITIKVSVGYIVTYTDPKLEFENLYKQYMLEIFRLMLLPYCYTKELQ